MSVPAEPNLCPDGTDLSTGGLGLKSGVIRVGKRPPKDRVERNSRDYADPPALALLPPPATSPLGLRAGLRGVRRVEAAADCVQKRLVAERAADQLAPPQSGEAALSASHVEKIGEGRRAVDERLHAYVAAPGAPDANLLAGKDGNPPFAAVAQVPFVEAGSNLRRPGRRALGAWSLCGALRRSASRLLDGSPPNGPIQRANVAVICAEREERRWISNPG